MIAALAPARCWCNAHDVGLACPPSVHNALKRNRARLERECTFVGMQSDTGLPDAECWTCHCGSSFFMKPTLAVVK